MPGLEKSEQVWEQKGDAAFAEADSNTVGPKCMNTSAIDQLYMHNVTFVPCCCGMLLHSLHAQLAHDHPQATLSSAARRELETVRMSASSA